MLPTVHYNMGGIPTNYHGEVVTLERRRSRRGGARPDGDRRGGLRLGARRQPARLQLAARPGGVRPRPRRPLRRDSSKPGRTSAPAAAGRRRRAKALGAPRPAAPRQGRHHRRRNCGWRCSDHAGHCAVFRTGEVLEEGVDKMTEVWAKAFGDIKVTDRSMIWNSDLVETLELDNLMARRNQSIIRRQPKGEPRRPCPRGLSRPRRRELDEAHAGVVNEDGEVRSTTGPSTPDHDDRRGKGRSRPRRGSTS